MSLYNIYNVDFDKLVTMLLPTFKRKSKIIKFLKSLTKPIIELQQIFTRFRLDTLYKINHNGQVVYLQKVLNDRFDKTARRIYITDGLFNDPTYVFPYQDDKDVYLNIQYIFNGLELAFKDVDFVVVLPSDINLSVEEDIRMKSLINYYKLASKTYKITQI